MTYHGFVTYRLIEYVSNKALKSMKEGNGKKDEDGFASPGLNKVHTVLINKLNESKTLKYIPLDKLKDTELPPLVPVKTENGFYVMNTGVEYSVVRLSKKRGYANKEDEKYLKSLVDKSREILSDPETFSEKDVVLLKKMIEHDAVSYKPVSMASFLTEVYQGIKVSPTLKALFEEVTGQKPTAKNIKSFSFEDIRHISDVVLGMKIFTPYFNAEKGGYAKKDTARRFNKHPDIDILKTSIIENVTSEEEKESLIYLLDKTVELSEKGSNIELLDDDGLNVEAFAEKESIFTELKNLTSPYAKSLKNTDKEKFLEENDKFLFFETNFSIEFESKENAPEEYLSPTLDKLTLLGNAEKIGIEFESTISVNNHGGKETIQDAIRMIKTQIEILSGSKEQSSAIKDIKDDNKNEQNIKTKQQASIKASSGFAL